MARAQADGLARLDAQLLAAHLLGHDRSWVLTHDEHVLTPAEQAAWRDLVARRLDGEPLAYLVGQREFHGLPLRVDRHVLVPRPDTETLVDWALELLAPQATAAVLDLGTGSGAIVLALVHRRPGLRAVAVDASAGALAVARGNGQALGLAVDWRQGRWFSPVQSLRFDLVVSNPPYVAEGDPHLADLRHEPIEALTAGPDGLADLRAIVADAPDHLVPGGWLLLEHGHDQAAAVAALLRGRGFAEVGSRADLAGHLRCTGGRWTAASAAPALPPHLDDAPAGFPA
ncbi:peptide chain release factor N(5)-glutamine methyltransferase [Piscinibacter sakaiensis]|uniref:Release factor glutamine methyltransferase n=1 Tax=Piscinibacter sakaiensis TaxID=1547922 RepID=A0A0K8NWW1_PISS1|nr:peptide chain release factor N(5)-glutamine methyltransferase [Piscinibacter sakaiensis]GAP34863.1 protein-N(5)-glutamine methyltransferase PrmC [Piscinibacter sakaiensis]